MDTRSCTSESSSPCSFGAPRLVSQGRSRLHRHGRIFFSLRAILIRPILVRTSLGHCALAKPAGAIPVVAGRRLPGHSSHEVASHVLPSIPPTRGQNAYHCRAYTSMCSPPLASLVGLFCATVSAPKSGCSLTRSSLPVPTQGFRASGAVALVQCAPDYSFG